MKKRKQKKGSLVGLLVRSYAAYMLLFFLGSTLWLFHSVLLYADTNHLPSLAQISKLDDHLTSKKFEHLPIDSLTTLGSFYEIFSYERGLVYTSNSKEKHPLTAKEVSVIPEFDEKYYLTWVPFKDQSGQSFSIVQRNYKDKKYIDEPIEILREEFDFLMDDQLRVISSRKPMAYTQFTERELKLMTHRFSDKYNLHRYNFTTKDGEKMALILYRPYDTEMEYKLFFSRVFTNLFLFFAICILLIFLFSYRIRRKIAKPLAILGNALETLPKNRGEEEVYVAYDGPKELVNISNTFNKISAELRESEQKRAQLEDSKRQMLADISHDLKTPITVIQGYAKAMEEGIIAEENQERYLQIIHYKASVLNDLINSFHEYSNIEHPDFSVQLKKVDFSVYLQQYWEKSYEEFALNQYPIDIELAEESMPLLLDSAKFDRVLHNVINNFFHYNPEGTTFYFRVQKEEKQVKITLADNGVPIEPEIFNPFVTGDRARTAGNRGSGLGLAIVDKIIRLHHGQVALDTTPSAPYVKAFVITLPLADNVEVNRV
ncbi:sensor histidine kinase [Streptococcus merionis]|uniref:sensor histidine kinase n=1 Tax=Streptococcus merionis TaxID=400065 RepID=UPI0035117C38